MKLEQSTLQYGGAGSETGYIDLARNLSAVNGKSITQTKRRKGKYRPLAFMVRIRALSGTITFQSLNCGYPTRNAVVLAGHARDEMLKSAGISRSNLESYQKELRFLYDAGMAAASAESYFPGATDQGTGSGGWGAGLTYDYTALTIEDPDTAGATITKPMMVLGTQAASSDDWDDDAGFFVVSNWLNWRHSFTPAAAADDIANNVFSWAIQQSDTAEAIIDRIDDEQDEKPYDLTEFLDTAMTTVASTEVGNPTTAIISVPLGLLKVVHSATSSWEIEVLGVTEL
jgi:hypothetical protein